MPAQNRRALIQQLEETRNTVARQSLLKQIWRLDRETARRQTVEASRPRPLPAVIVVSVAATATVQ